MTLYRVPPLSTYVPAIAYLNYGHRSEDCALTMAADGAAITVATTTEGGQQICEVSFDAATARALVEAIDVNDANDVRKPGSDVPPVPGLSRPLMWELSGSTPGAEYCVRVVHLDEIGAWLHYALGDERWDFANNGDTWEW